MLRPNGRTPITDADFEAVREMAAQGRPIPAIVMNAILERLAAKAAEAEVPAEALQPQLPANSGSTDSNFPSL